MLLHASLVLHPQVVITEPRLPCPGWDPSDRLPARFPKRVSASIREGFLHRLELIERT